MITLYVCQQLTSTSTRTYQLHLNIYLSFNNTLPWSCNKFIDCESIPRFPQNLLGCGVYKNSTRIKTQQQFSPFSIIKKPIIWHFFLMDNWSNPPTHQWAFCALVKIGIKYVSPLTNILEKPNDIAVFMGLFSYR